MFVDFVEIAWIQLNSNKRHIPIKRNIIETYDP